MRFMMFMYPEISDEGTRAAIAACDAAARERRKPTGCGSPP